MNEKLNQFQDDVKESAGRIWLAGLGALAIAGEEGSKLFNTLVEKGADFEKKEDGPTEGVKKAVHSAKEQVEDVWSKVEGTFNDRVAGALEKLGVPTKTEIKDLTSRVDALTEAITKLSEQQAK